MREANRPNAFPKGKIGRDQHTVIDTFHGTKILVVISSIRCAMEMGFDCDPKPRGKLS